MTSNKAATAIDLACRALGAIDFLNERETTQRARDDIKTLARLFDLDAETLWRDACENWRKIARDIYESEKNND